MTPPGTWLRRVQMAATIVSIVLFAYMLLPPMSYHFQDPQQEYLSARALRDGVDIFTPVAELALRYFPFPVASFPHPNPHPPITVLLSLPLSYLPFPLVSVLWLVVNVALMIRIGTWLGLSRWMSLALLIWPPIHWVVDVGQFELLLLAMTMLAWKAAERGKDREAGIWLGVAAAIKLYPAFFVLPYLARRRFKIVGMSAVVFALGQLVNLAVVGPAGLWDYYTRILPTVSAIYQRSWISSSPLATLSRLFGWSPDSAPVLEAPEIVLPLTLLFAAIGLVAALTLSPKVAPLAMLVAIPNGWGYYATLALPQIVALWRRYGPSPLMVCSLILCSIAQVNGQGVSQALTQVTGMSLSVRSPIIGILMALQLIGYLGLLFLSVKAEKGAEISVWLRKVVGERQAASVES